MDYSIKLTPQELQTIYLALGELPLKISANIFGKIQLQQKEQDDKNALNIGKSLDNS